MIVQCFTVSKANAFDYNLLEPLQKLLRLSSPIAGSLTRTDLLTGILQKLNHKKAVVRLNLLRIVRSICDASGDEAESIRHHPLFEVIQHLAENDSAVLVRNMASELVKFNLDKASESGSGSRSRLGPRRGSSFTAPSLQHSVSTPLTPTQASRMSQTSAFIDGSVTPYRRSGITSAASSSTESVHYRPRTTEGTTSIMRKASGDLTNGTPVSKSRLPRTALLRASRSSIAAPQLRDDPSHIRRENRENRENRDNRDNRDNRENRENRENGVRPRERDREREPIRPTSSNAVSGSDHKLNRRRTTRPPSGDIKWS